MVKLPEYFDILDYLETYQVDENTLNPVYKYIYDYEWCDDPEVTDKWVKLFKNMVQFVLSTKFIELRTYEEIISSKVKTPIDLFYEYTCIDDEIHTECASKQRTDLKDMINFLSITNLSFDKIYID